MSAVHLFVWDSPWTSLCFLVAYSLDPSNKTTTFLNNPLLDSMFCLLDVNSPFPLLFPFRMYIPFGFPSCLFLSTPPFWMWLFIPPSRNRAPFLIVCLVTPSNLAKYIASSFLIYWRVRWVLVPWPMVSEAAMGLSSMDRHRAPGIEGQTPEVSSTGWDASFPLDVSTSLAQPCPLS